MNFLKPPRILSDPITSFATAHQSQPGSMTCFGRDHFISESILDFIFDIKLVSQENERKSTKNTQSNGMGTTDSCRAFIIEWQERGSPTPTHTQRGGTDEGAWTGVAEEWERGLGDARTYLQNDQCVLVCGAKHFVFALVCGNFLSWLRAHCS